MPKAKDTDTKDKMTWDSKTTHILLGAIIGMIMFSANLMLTQQATMKTDLTVQIQGVDAGVTTLTNKVNANDVNIGKLFERLDGMKEDQLELKGRFETHIDKDGH